MNDRADNVRAQNAPAPTSAAVARHAGVSRATVSYVLNGQAAGKVSAATQAKVKKAAQELGYVPHAAARSLRSGSSALVLIAVPADRVPAFGPLFSAFVARFQTALERHGYTGVLHGARADRSPEDTARAWAELRPAAVLAAFGAPLTAASVGILRRSGTRAVLSFGPPPAPGAHGITMDQEEIGAVAAAHLLAGGRRRLGVVVPREHGLEPFSGPRLAGAEAAARVFPGASVTALPLAHTEESAAQVAARVRESGLDAVFAYNDEYAMLLMRALQDAGVGIPGDVALVGADDLLLARLLRPRLTSVRTRLPEPEEVAALVDRLISDPSVTPGERFRSAAHIEVRESSTG
ncbi:LacI family DNA-binding transcriptional regulator [Streptomyces sp. VRA16 Mangrove soil]|uniref:LacI family DNA-binding transcriptional regulator n=1 Tax=Streptomyces sp. VRA16 Mangrove soil TaxID=2817434 RepID=UPI001A9F9464|nr:LacI family DNA-binding transcriptional regulator [Streptomyces sp. VRA16 Mangrove soil]MBO1335546.1 LacI family DNA-binding transcriptional regulator [Streptomyces sp. VRA16 Mangrove soil]